MTQRPTYRPRPAPRPAPEDVTGIVRSARRGAPSRRDRGRRGARRREALISFSEAWGTGVYAAFRRQDVFPNEHPNYLGHLTLGTPQETLKALEEADLVLVVGCRLSEVTTQSYSLPRGDQAVIQIDIDPDEVGATVPAEIGLVSDAGTALAALAAQAPSSAPGADLGRGPQGLPRLQHDTPGSRQGRHRPRAGRRRHARSPA